MTNSLWVAGLAVCLAAFSWGDYQAWGQQAARRQAVAGRGFRAAFNAGGGLFCLGLLGRGGPWWEQVLWGVLAGAFAVQVAWAVVRRPNSPASGPWAATGRLAGEGPTWRWAAQRLAGWEIWIVGALVAAGMASERLLPWGVAGAAVFWAVRWLAFGRPTTARTPADWGIAVIALMVPVTLWATANPEVTHPGIWRLLGGVALYYAVANWAANDRRVRLVAQAALLAALGLAAYGLVFVAWPAGGLAGQAAKALAGSGLDQVNVNVMGASLVVLLPLPLAWLAFGWRQSNWVERALAAATGMALVGMVVGTQSRGAWLALAAAVAALAVLRWRWGWLLVGVLGVGGGVMVWNLGATTALDALMRGGIAGSLEARLEIWSRALYMVQDFPFTGVGMGMFGSVADLLYPFFLVGPSSITHAHNLYLQVAVDLGVPGLVGWLSVAMVVSVAAWDVYRRGKGAGEGWIAGLGAGLVCCQVALLVHGLVDSAIWGEIRTAPLVWALWGLTAASATAVARRFRLPKREWSTAGKN